LAYWRGTKDLEVDVVMQMGAKLLPFEVKYRSQHTDWRDLKGLAQLCEQKQPASAFVVTKSMRDFGRMPALDGQTTQVLKIPAALLCFWLGE
jgi:predicted AAA+ superfamily ATPase